MLVTLVAIVINAVAFKLGWDAGNLAKEGKNAGEITAQLTANAVNAVSSFGKGAYATVSNWLSKCR